MGWRSNFGQSVVKLDPTLHVQDFFAPFNANQLNIGDHDLGSGGVLLVPDQSGAFPHEAVVCGKNDPIFVINRDNMGRKNAADNNQIIQSVLGQLGGATGLQAEDHCFTTAAFFQQTLYFIGNNDVIKAFSLDAASGKLSLTPTSKGSFIFPFPGGQPVVSSNGTSNGIVWAVDNNSSVIPARLRCNGCFPRTVPKSFHRAGGQMGGAHRDQRQSLRGHQDQARSLRLELAA